MQYKKHFDYYTIEVVFFVFCRYEILKINEVIFKIIFPL